MMHQFLQTRQLALVPRYIVFFSFFLTHTYVSDLYKYCIDKTIMIQVGIGVAVAVFGLVFALGDFLPSGRYATTFRTEQYT